VKLDSAPVTLAGLNPTISQPEIQESTQAHLATAIIEPVEDSHKKQEPALAVFATTFVTIFLAEIGDKTQLSTLFTLGSFSRFGSSISYYKFVRCTTRELGF